ncbi:MAG: hypothetical protein WAW17_12700 [Rhodococcus sp. (in: high G+C Gram-positive bacteria)]|uniref:hypothetical protein n=1 Tax=Rhodococcus sp. TaxID=1831 RepID=UPI003BB123BE
MTLFQPADARRPAAVWVWATATTVQDALSSALDVAMTTMHQEHGEVAHPINTSHTTTICSSGSRCAPHHACASGPDARHTPAERLATLIGPGGDDLLVGLRS